MMIPPRAQKGMEVRSISHVYYCHHKHYRSEETLSELFQSRFLVEGDATKHFSVKKKGFSVKRGEAIE